MNSLEQQRFTIMLGVAAVVPMLGQPCKQNLVLGNTCASTQNTIKAIDKWLVTNKSNEKCASYNVSEFFDKQSYPRKQAAYVQSPSPLQTEKISCIPSRIAS
jgi:hypothetical protein